MGKVLRALVIVILLLSIASLVLAVMLYNKRELLVNRTHLLEDQFAKIAKTIESADPQKVVQPNYSAKDVSPVTSKELDTPERSTFWNTYQYKLETANLPTMLLDSDAKKLQLRHYYQTTGPVGSEVRVKDPLNPGEYSTKGTGTMRELLDQVLDRATKQYATLKETRGELQKLREELSATIEDYNKIKHDARADKKAVEDKGKEVDRLGEEITTLKSKVSGLDDEKKTLTAAVTDFKKDNETKLAQIDDLSKKLKERDATIQTMKGTPEHKGPAPVAQAEAYQGAPGDKGKIVAVDDKLKFVVIDLSPAAMTELVGEQRDRPMPQVEMMVRRPGLKSATGSFVTRIKFREVVRQKNLVVADILGDWQQLPVEINDVVFF